MTWPERAIAQLVAIAARTATEEKDCDALLTGLAALAEAMTPVERALVRQHLAICVTCREELAALRLAIRPAIEPASMIRD